jgi:hypothetical protein
MEVRTGVWRSFSSRTPKPPTLWIVVTRVLTPPLFAWTRCVRNRHKLPVDYRRDRRARGYGAIEMHLRASSQAVRQSRLSHPLRRSALSGTPLIGRYGYSTGGKPSSAANGTPAGGLPISETPLRVALGLASDRHRCVSVLRSRRFERSSVGFPGGLATTPEWTLRFQGTASTNKNPRDSVSI